MACSVQSLVYLPSLSSQLLLRNMPNFSRYSSSPPMCLSSRNSSNYKGLCHIMPCVAQVCKGMIYSKTGVPWQMNKTLIINFSCSECPVLPCFALIYRLFRASYFYFLKLHFLQNNAKRSKSLPSVVVKS